MLVDPLTDADCTCLWTLAITVHRPCCAARTDHLTKVVQTLYLVYIPPNEMGSPQTACYIPFHSRSVRKTMRDWYACCGRQIQVICWGTSFSSNHHQRGHVYMSQIVKWKLE